MFPLNHIGRSSTGGCTCWIEIFRTPVQKLIEHIVLNRSVDCFDLT